MLWIYIVHGVELMCSSLEDKEVIGIILDTTVTEMYEIDETEYELYTEWTHIRNLTVEELRVEAVTWSSEEGYTLNGGEYSFRTLIDECRDIMEDINFTKKGWR